jgi:uncharacterized protein with HEPN domain
MPFIDVADRLKDILQEIREIEAFARGRTFDDYMSSTMLRRAVERSIEIISEASRHVPDDLKARHPQIPWRRVAGAGNVLRHGYKLIRDDEIWRIATTELQPLKSAAELTLREIEPDRGS